MTLTPRSSRRHFIQATASAGALASIGAPLFAQTPTLTYKWANNLPVTHPLEYPHPRSGGCDQAREQRPR